MSRRNGALLRAINSAMRHKKRVLLAVASAFAAALLFAAIAQSWITMTSVVVGLGLGLAVTLIELRRTRAAMRGLRQRVERADERIMELATKDKAAGRDQRQLERTQANLRAGFTHLSTSLYDALRQTHDPFTVRMEVAQALPTARGLIKRGDVLDAHALLATNNALRQLDGNVLRTLRGALRQRGYLTKVLEVARVLTLLAERQPRHVCRGHGTCVRIP